jgi:hypothetical protein
MRSWNIKFIIADEMHYMVVPADTPQEALAIFKEWLFGASGVPKDEPIDSVWRELEDKEGNVKTRFRNDFVSSYEVLSHHFLIR